MRTLAGSAAVYFGFLMTGVVTVLVGALLPQLQDRWNVGPSQIGSLFLFQFVASSLGAVMSTWRARRSLIGGYLAIALGLSGLAVADLRGAHLAVAAVGFGTGLAIPSSNLVVSHANASRRASALSQLNLVWGLGAVGCPLLVAVVSGRLPLPVFLLILAGTCVLTAALLAIRLDRPAPPAETPTDRSATVGVLLLIALQLFLYVGIETTVGGWLVALADDRHGGSVLPLLIGSTFWAALLAGRAIASVLLRRVAEGRMLTVALPLALAGVLGLGLFGGSVGIAGAAAIAGLGLAPIFPVTLALLTRSTAADGSRTTGWVFAAAGLGGAALPWLSGRVAGSLDDLGGAFLLPFLGLVLLASTSWSLRALASPASLQDGLPESGVVP